MKNLRQIIAAFAILTLCISASTIAYADSSKDVQIQYIVTEDMVKVSPSPTPKPTATPSPAKSSPTPSPAIPNKENSSAPKTGDEFNMRLYVLIASASLLAGLTVYVYYKRGKETDGNRER